MTCTLVSSAGVSFGKPHSLRSCPITLTSLFKGLQEALAFAQGSESEAVVHIPDEIDVKRIRNKMQMSQSVFASTFGFSARTVQEWEQGRRMPVGPAKTFLHVIDNEPDAVRRALTLA